MTRTQNVPTTPTGSRTSYGCAGLPKATTLTSRYVVKGRSVGSGVFSDWKKEKCTVSSLPSCVTYMTRTTSFDVDIGQSPHAFALMRNVGSLYEEMARQLESTRMWEKVLVRRSCNDGGIIDASHGRPVRFGRITLFLGEKLSAERIIEARRRSCRGEERHHSIRSSGAVTSSNRGEKLLVVNYVEKLRCITLKGSMVSTLLEYYSNSWEVLGEYMPLTFRIIPRNTCSDDRRIMLRVLQNKSNYNTLWIVKSSSGCHGDNMEIFCNNEEGVTKILKHVDTQKESYMWVVQLYIDRPLLYHRRKFDIRCWVLLCADKYEIYVHEQLVMRMSSVEYKEYSPTTQTSLGRLAHITNHCVQEQSENFEAFEEGNELWKEHLDAVVRYKGKKLLERGITHDGANADLKPSLKNTILPQIHHIAVETLLAGRGAIPGERSPLLTPCFQVFGYDFLVDERLRVWLLEINGSPGVAERLLPSLVADTIEIALTPFFSNTTKDVIHCGGISKRNGYVKVYP